MNRGVPGLSKLARARFDRTAPIIGTFSSASFSAPTAISSSPSGAWRSRSPACSPSWRSTTPDTRRRPTRDLTARSISLLQDLVAACTHPYLVGGHSEAFVRTGHDHNDRLHQPGLFPRSRRCGQTAAPARPARAGQVPHHRHGMDDDDAGGGRPRSQGQRQLHPAQGGPRRRRPVVAAALHADARQQHADLRRARPHAAALHRRRGLPPPRRPRHGAAHRRDRRHSSRATSSPKAVPPISCNAMRAGCRLRSSASCSACRLPTGQKFMTWADRAVNVTNAAGFLLMIPGIFAIKRYLERRSSPSASTAAKA